MFWKKRLLVYTVLYSCFLSRSGSVCTVCSCSGGRVCWGILFCNLVFFSRKGSVCTVCPCSGNRVYWSVLYCTPVPFQSRFLVYCGPNVREVESDGLYFTLIFFPEPVPRVLSAHVLKVESDRVYCIVLLFPFQSRFRMYCVPMFWK